MNRMLRRYRMLMLFVGLGLTLAGLVLPAGADDATTWLYDERPDAMGRGTIKHAMVISTNTITFAFPYGPQEAIFHLRTHPRYGKSLMLRLMHGHFLCHTYDDSCRVTVRIDGGKPQSFKAVGPDDHSTETLFIQGYDQLLPQLRKAKKLQIEAMFYRDGRRVFEFDVAGLTWETPKAKDHKLQVAR
jgi:hypothetical protein